MALSGSFVKTIHNSWKLIIEWTASQNIENNYSTVTVKTFLTGDYAIYSGSTNNGRIKIDGTSYNYTLNASLNAGQKKLLNTTSKKVYHDSSGEKSFNISGFVEMNVTLSGTYKGRIDFVNYNNVLNSIPQASKLKNVPDSFLIDENVAIGIDKASPDFTHKLIASINGYLIAERDGDLGVNLTLTESEQNVIYSQIPNATQGNVKLQLNTYKNGVFMGSVVNYISGEIPTNIKPYFLGISHSEANAKMINSGLGVYLKNMSQLKIFLQNVSATKYATIKEIKFAIDGKYYFSNNATTAIIANSGNLLCTGIVIDSRGREYRDTLEIPIQSYEPPKIEKVEPDRYKDTSGTQDRMGSYLGITILGVVDSIMSGTTEKNTARIRIYTKLKNATSWNIIYDNSWNLSIMSTWGYYPNYDIEKVYDVRVEVEDKLNIVRIDRPLPKATITGEWGEDGQSIGTPYVDGDGVLQLASPYGQDDAFKLINFSGGYYLYRDNTSNVDGGISRAWFDAPHNGEYVIGPRNGTHTLKHFRVRAQSHSFEGGPIYNGAVRKLDNGYTVLPNEIILAWGRATRATGDSNVVVTLPITFPNSIFGVNAQVRFRTADSLAVTTTVEHLNTSSIRIHVRDKDGNYPGASFYIEYFVWGH